MTLAIGTTAPAFEREAHDGSTVHVGGARARVLVLYFYPASETPGCTREACSFRDEYESFTDAGAEVVGVSPDPLEKQRAFVSHHRLPFRLLSDADGSLRRAYDVGTTLGILPGRVTFVIDTEGVIRHVFNSQIRVYKHVGEALRIVRTLATA